jgi:hypothetical protein
MGRFEKFMLANFWLFVPKDATLYNVEPIMRRMRRIGLVLLVIVAACVIYGTVVHNT